MEARFARDFSAVRIHADAESAAAARGIAAAAYTVGRDVVFAAGRYAPETPVGRRLLAHELTHVVQQGGRVPRTDAVVDRGHPTEIEAGRVSDAVARGSAAGPIVQRGPTAISRQETEAAQPSAAVPHDWYMLKPPPVVVQQPLTCWAAALSSWLAAMGVQKAPVIEIVYRYAGTSCIDPDNSLPIATADEVFAEWSATFRRYETPKKLTSATVRYKLQTEGHLILAETKFALGHTLVIYGMGFDEKRQPNPDYVSVMDPLSGSYKNVPISSFAYPVLIGHLTKRTRPAPCLRTSGKDPEAEEQEGEQ